MAVWECETEAVASRGVDGPREREMVALVRHGGYRLNATGGNPPPQEGEETPTGCMVGKHLARVD